MHFRFEIEGELLSKSQNPGKPRPDGTSVTYRRAVVAYGTGSKSVDIPDNPEGAKLYLDLPPIGETVKVAGRVTSRVFDGKASETFSAVQLVAGEGSARRAA